MEYYLVITEDEDEPGELYEELGGACLAAHDALAKQLGRHNTGTVVVQRVTTTRGEALGGRALEKSLGAK